MTAPSAPPSIPGERRYAPGDLIGSKYLLRHVIGSGGMGTVWAATNLDLELAVALKVVNPGAHRDEIAARLSAEARAAAKLQHPGIVRVIDLGITEHGEPFLVMELLEGESLAALVERVGPLEARAAIRLMLPVIDALRFAHSRNVVHRDLKPDNIFLAREAGQVRPKIVDFGIAQLGKGALGRRNTGDGTVVGSPGYMAPEHARGSEVDHRADIFTVCQVLYECITGAAAFEGDGYDALLRAVIEQELPPITWYGFGDAALSRILERGLRKDPAKRFASCDELGRALATWLAATGETEDVTGAPLRGRWLSRPTPSSCADEVSGRSSITRRRPPHSTGSEHSVALPTTVKLETRRFGGKTALAALVISGFLIGFGVTTSVDGFGWNIVSTRAASVAATASPASGGRTESTSVVADEPVVRPAEPGARPEKRPAAVANAAVARSAGPMPRKLVRPNAVSTPYPVPRTPAFALPSEPALMTVANAAARSDLKDPYQ